MISREQAKALLRLAGVQIASRETVVTKQPMRAENEKRMGAPVTLGAGSVSYGDARYVGPAGRMTEDDPHQGCYAVVWAFAATQDGGSDEDDPKAAQAMREAAMTAFSVVYVREEALPHSLNRVHYRLVEDMRRIVAHLPEELTISAEVWADYVAWKRGRKNELKRMTRGRAMHRALVERASEAWHAATSKDLEAVA